MDNIKMLLSQAKQDIKNGNEIDAGILLHEILREDFNNNEAWLLLHQLFNENETLEEFKNRFTKKYYPENYAISREKESFSNIFSQYDEKEKSPTEKSRIKSKNYFGLTQRELWILVIFTIIVFIVITAFILFSKYSNRETQIKTNTTTGISIPTKILNNTQITSKPAIAPTYTPTPTSIKVYIMPSSTPVLITGCVNISNINVREGPGTQYYSLGSLVKPVCVSIIERNVDSSWVWVETLTIQGWVAVDYLFITGDVTSVPVSTKPLPPPVNTKVVPTKTSSPMETQPPPPPPPPPTQQYP